MTQQAHGFVGTTDIEFSRQKAASFAADGAVLIWDINDFVIQSSINIPQVLYGMRWSTDGAQLALVHGGGVTMVTDRGEIQWEMAFHEQATIWFNRPSWTLDGKGLIVGHKDDAGFLVVHQGGSTILPYPNKDGMYVTDAVPFNDQLAVLVREREIQLFTLPSITTTKLIEKEKITHPHEISSIAAQGNTLALLSGTTLQLWKKDGQSNFPVSDLQDQYPTIYDWNQEQMILFANGEYHEISEKGKLNKYEFPKDAVYSRLWGEGRFFLDQQGALYKQDAKNQFKIPHRPLINVIGASKDTLLLGSEDGTLWGTRKGASIDQKTPPLKTLEVFGEYIIALTKSGELLVWEELQKDPIKIGHDDGSIVDFCILREAQTVVAISQGSTLIEWSLDKKAAATERISISSPTSITCSKDENTIYVASRSGSLISVVDQKVANLPNDSYNLAHIAQGNGLGVSNESTFVWKHPTEDKTFPIKATYAKPSPDGTHWAVVDTEGKMFLVSEKGVTLLPAPRRVKSVTWLAEGQLVWSGLNVGLLDIAKPQQWIEIDKNDQSIKEYSAQNTQQRSLKIADFFTLF